MDILKLYKEYLPLFLKKRETVWGGRDGSTVNSTVFFPEMLGSTPTTNMMTQNHVYLQSKGIRCPSLALVGAACTQCTEKHRGKTIYTQRKKVSIFVGSPVIMTYSSTS